MAAIYRSRILVVFLLLGLSNRINSQQSNAVDASPFFFHCEQFDRLQDDWDANQPTTRIAQVELSGNPRFYAGGQVYKGKIIFCLNEILLSRIASSMQMFHECTSKFQFSHIGVLNVIMISFRVVTVRLTEYFDSALITGVYSTTPSDSAGKQVNGTVSINATKSMSLFLLLRLFIM